MPNSEIVNSRHAIYEKAKDLWKEQDLAFFGGRPWTDYAINQHALETTQTTQTLSGAKTRYTSRLFYADNPVRIDTPIQNVVNSAQQSNDAEIDAGDDYLNLVLNNNVDGEGLSWYTWLTKAPLEAGTRNGIVYLGVMIPATDIENPTLEDVTSGSVPPPKWFHLSASQVVQWTETEGDVEVFGQFSDIMYKSSRAILNQKTGFLDEKEILVRITKEEIIEYEAKDGEIISLIPNPFGIVPIFRVDLGSLIKDAVQYSKIAVEIDSLSVQNMRDGYFNVPVMTGGKAGDGFVLSSDSIVELSEGQDFKFVAPEATPEKETREKIQALQNQMDISVQQAHTNFAKKGASVASGVALKEISSDKGASVKFFMDRLLEKFRVTVGVAKALLGITGGEIVLTKPSSYVFVSDTEKLEQGEIYQIFSDTAPSVESQKHYNSLKNSSVSKLTGKDLKQLNEADDKAIEERKTSNNIVDFNENQTIEA